MEENVRTGDNILKNIWFAVKRNIVLVLAVVLFCTACGVGYSFLKKPNYTATEEVVCTASEEGGGNIVTNFNIMNAYINTIVDFCDEGVVIERANYYYTSYQNRKIDPKYADGDGYTLDEFIYDIERVEDDYSTYGGTEAANKNFIVKENVSVSAKVETEETDEYAFSIGYTDPDKDQAVIKAKIYALAFRREIGTDEGTNGDKYFDSVIINITLLGSSGVVSDVSKVKCTVIGFVIGLIIAAVAVYIISITDVSIKSREELEAITGTALLANIDYEGGK